MIAAVISVTVIACSKQDSISKDDSNVGGFVIKASVDENETKGTYDADGSFKWAKGDKIGVDMWDSTHNWPEPMVLNDADDGKTEGTFTTTQTYACGNVAFYPWNGWETGDAGTHFDTDKLWINLRSTIDYTNAEGNVQNLIPIAAKISNKDGGSAQSETNVQFKQIASGVKVTITNVPAFADKVTLTIPGKNITGWFYIGKDDIDGSHGITYGNSGSSTITIQFAASSTVTSKTFVFPVPPTEIPGITLKVYAFDTAIWSGSIGAQSTLSVGQVLKLKDVTLSKQIVKVGLIEHITSRESHVVHYWGGSTASDASLIKIGGDSQETSTVYMSNWGQNKTFYWFYSIIPSDATSYKIWNGNSNSAYWYGGDGSTSKPTVYVYVKDDVSHADYY